MNENQATYFALVGVAAMGMTPNMTTPDCHDSGLVRVVPRDPANSLLMQILNGTQTCGSRMPPGGALTAGQIEQVRTWIANGAANDWHPCLSSLSDPLRVTCPSPSGLYHMWRMRRICWAVVLVTAAGCADSRTGGRGGGAGTSAGDGAVELATDDSGQSPMVSDDGAAGADMNEAMTAASSNDWGAGGGSDASDQTGDASVEQCMLLDGVYTMSFELLSGDCGEVDLHFVELGGSRAGINSTTMLRTQDTLTTEVIDKGCSLRWIVTVTSRETGFITSIMDGELDVVGPEEFSGTVERFEFDDSNMMSCQGTYRTIATRT